MLSIIILEHLQLGSKKSPTRAAPTLHIKEGIRDRNFFGESLKDEVLGD